MSLHLTPTYQIFYTERGAIDCTEFSIKELKNSLSWQRLAYSQVQVCKMTTGTSWVVTLYDYRTNLLADSALSEAFRFCLSLICCAVNVCFREHLTKLLQNNLFVNLFLLLLEQWVFFYPEQSFSRKDHEASGY